MSPPDPIPHLENGDCLSREEFERRYIATPEVNRAELIEGVVYMPSPVRWQHHSSPHADLVGWLATYRARTLGVAVGDNGSVRLDPKNEPQPDVTMLILPSHGGQASISDDDYVEGAPELVAEVAASSASIDLNAKFRAYQRNGVKEYIVWRVTDGEIDWFVLRSNGFVRLPVGEDKIMRSEVFPGLWLDVPAMVRSDLATVLEVLQRGLASADHTDFVNKLAKASR